MYVSHGGSKLFGEDVASIGCKLYVRRTIINVPFLGLDGESTEYSGHFQRMNVTHARGSDGERCADTIQPKIHASFHFLTC